ncbi:hypothetical protein Ahu01nite_059460 [Winogradskya humida]|uniref:Uncharacterized protein n=1 Tax=Winogradskya humida TaxID=113566 RepID=A0ABQ3ZW88_9ACTN|nr:hypothetical protein Ahu01nite_059460 [Actinoplanes humidus]
MRNAQDSSARNGGTGEIQRISAEALARHGVRVCTPNKYPCVLLDQHRWDLLVQESPYQASHHLAGDPGAEPHGVGSGARAQEINERTRSALLSGHDSL